MLVKLARSFFREIFRFFKYYRHDDYVKINRDWRTKEWLN